MNVVPDTSVGIAKAMHILTQGGVLAHATETCYGLACDLTNPEAVAKLFAVKKRPSDQPVSALFSSIEEAKRYVVWNTRAEELAKEYLPGPLTIILPMKKNMPGSPEKHVTLRSPALCDSSSGLTMTQRTGRLEGHFSGLPSLSSVSVPTLAFRLSSHPTAQALVETFGSPLSTTSANLHGKPETFSAREIMEQFSGREHQPDLIIDSGTLPKSLPSTIVDLSGTEEKVLRMGTITIETIP